MNTKHSGGIVMRSLAVNAFSTIRTDRYWQLTLAALLTIALWYIIAPHLYHGPTNKIEAMFVAGLGILAGVLTGCGLIFGKRMRAVIFTDQSPVLLLAIMAIAISWAFRFG